MITITQEAVAKLKELSEAEDIGHTKVRVKVLGGGCHGMVHDMSFDDVISDFDEVVEIDNISVIIDQMSFQYLENIAIDYSESLMGGGFTFASPDIKGSCGCGRSVSY